MISVTSLMGTIALNLLGGFEARAEDGTPLSLPTQKYKALLAFLATPAGRSHSRDGLVALLWGDLRHEQARGALRQALWALRRTLNTDRTKALVLEGESVALNCAAVSVDVSDFVHAASQSEPDSLARGATVYRGAFLAGLSAREAPFEEWLVTERERLAELALATLARLLAHQRTSGALDEAVQTGLRLLAINPLQEAVHRMLMQLYTQRGSRAAALRQYQSCVGVLQGELGVEPELETRALYQEILRQRSIDHIVRQSWPPTAPRRPTVTPSPPSSRLRRR